MAQSVKTIGPSYGLRFDMTWSGPAGSSSADEATYGRVLAWLGEDLVWGEISTSGDVKPVKWSWIDFLEFLARSWSYITLESGYPLGLQPVWPSQIHAAAENRWQSMPDSRVREEEKFLLAFEETHNLACGVQGYFLPPLWVVREQGIVSLGSEKTTIRRPVAEVITALRELGDEISSRIRGLSDKQSRLAIRAWESRDKQDHRKLAEIVTGLTAADLEQITHGNSLEAAFELEDIFQITEMLDLVGMTRGHLDMKQMADVVAKVKALPHLQTPELDSLSSEAEAALGEITTVKRTPWDQGYELALLYRAKPGITDNDGRVDPENLLAKLSVVVQDDCLGGDGLDAIACWGPHHGPAVLVNQNPHMNVSGARRATLAHELCHLLADRKDALPLGDVINGNVPLWIEQRANAFAAELMLPRSLARQAANRIKDIKKCVDELTLLFGVSKELAAWQIRNSDYNLDPTEKNWLRTLVGNPRNF